MGAQVLYPGAVTVAAEVDAVAGAVGVDIAVLPGEGGGDIKVEQLAAGGDGGDIAVVALNSGLCVDAAGVHPGRNRQDRQQIDLCGGLQREDLADQRAIIARKSILIGKAQLVEAELDVDFAVGLLRQDIAQRLLGRRVPLMKI